MAAPRVTHYAAHQTRTDDGMFLHYRLDLFTADPEHVTYPHPLALTIRWQANVYPEGGRPNRWYGHNLELPYDTRNSEEMKRAVQVLAWLEKRTKDAPARFGIGPEPQDYLDALEKAHAVEVIHDPRLYRWLTPAEVKPEEWQGYIARSSDGKSYYSVVAESEEAARVAILRGMAERAETDDDLGMAYYAEQLERWLADGRIISTTAAYSFGTRPGWSRTAREKAESIPQPETVAEPVAEETAA